MAVVVYAANFYIFPRFQKSSFDFHRVDATATLKCIALYKWLLFRLMCFNAVAFQKSLPLWGAVLSFLPIQTISMEVHQFTIPIKEIFFIFPFVLIQIYPGNRSANVAQIALHTPINSNSLCVLYHCMSHNTHNINTKTIGSLRCCTQWEVKYHWLNWYNLYLDISWLSYIEYISLNRQKF